MMFYVWSLLFWLTINRVYSTSTTTTGNGVWYGLNCDSDFACKLVNPLSYCAIRNPKAPGSGICQCETNYVYNSTENKCQKQEAVHQNSTRLYHGFQHSQKTAIIGACVAAFIGCGFTAFIVYIKKRNARSDEIRSKKYILKHIVVLSPSATKF